MVDGIGCRCSDGSSRRHGNNISGSEVPSRRSTESAASNGELWTSRLRTIGDPDIVFSLRVIVEISGRKQDCATQIATLTTVFKAPYTGKHSTKSSRTTQEAVM